MIAFASRGLRPNERNCPAHKLEFLALKWAVSDKFRDYLYGNSFKVRTDNNPLTYVLSTAKLDATSHRWLASLANFDFEISYRSGKSNVDADVLSDYHLLVTHLLSYFLMWSKLFVWGLWFLLKNFLFSNVIPSLRLWLISRSR